MSHNRYLPNEIPADARLRVFAFPYAGGGAAPYFRWRGAMPRGIDLVPLLLPGREARIAEPALCDMHTLAAEVADAIAPLVDRPYALLGHSMGAWIALEVARKLRDRGADSPRALIVAASPAPQRSRGNAALYQLPDSEFVAEMIRRFNGIPPAVEKNRELLQLLIPTMRADMQLLETYDYVEEPPLSTDILALGGADDRAVSATALADWRQQAAGEFTSRLWPGNHFFLFHSEQAATGALTPAARWIAGRLERYLEP
ncbi:MAG: thioesterase II family protein [Pirellulales bacterium]